MNNFSKKIDLDNYNSLNYYITDGYVPVTTVVAISKKDFNRTIKFSRWDDYSFSSHYDIDFDEYEKLNKESHTFSKSHSLYIPLLHLLNGKKELIIDDDETCEINKKYMKIYIDGDNINIDFINELEKDESFDKFHIFIKNIGFDLRSKIDCENLDTKERLYFFFKEIDEYVNEKYHQMTIEEYLLNNSNLSLEESKKYVKKLHL